MSDKKINIFKDYLKPTITYRGGKTLNEVDPNIKVYKLSSNENLLGSSPLALEAIRNSVDKLNLYPDRTDTRLQDALYDFYDGALEREQFINGPSGSEVIELIIRAFMGEGKECVISNPAFLVYQMFSEKMGSKVIDVPLLAPDFRMNVEGILNAINENTRLVFLTSPNNPTGSYIPKEDLDLYFSKVPDHIVTVLDEVYFQYADAPDFVRALHYVNQGKQVIGLNSFSKAYGLAGLRVGYAYTTPEIAAYVRQLYKPFMINILAIEAILAALKDDDFIQRTVNLVKQEKQKYYKEFQRLSIKHWPSQSNFILIDPAMDEYEFESKMFSQGIMVRPVSNFGAPGLVRITIGTEEANAACFKALESIYV